MVGRAARPGDELRVDVDRIVARAIEQATGDEDVVELLVVALEQIAVAFLHREQRVEVGEHPAAGQLGLERLEIEPVEVAEHRELEVRVGRQRVVDVRLDRRRLRDPRRLATVDRRLVVAEQRLAAAARGEVDVDRGEAFAVEAERRRQGTAGAVERRPGDEDRAAREVIDPIGVVEIAVADVTARLAPGRVGHRRGDLDVDVAGAALRDDRVDQRLRGGLARKIGALTRTVGILDFLHRENVGCLEVEDDVLGQQRELGVARIEVLEVVGGYRQVSGVAGQRGHLLRQGNVLGHDQRLGGDHFVGVERVVDDAGHAGELVADRQRRAGRGEWRAGGVDLDLLGVEIARAQRDPAAVVDPRGARAERGDDVGLAEAVGVRDRLRSLDRHPHALERFPEIDPVVLRIVDGEAVVIDDRVGRQDPARADQQRIGQRVAGADDGDRRGGQFGQCQAGRAWLELGHGADDADRIARAHGRRGAGEHEHPVRGPRVAVAAVLEEEAVGIDPGDDARGPDLLPGEAGEMPLALKRADRDRGEIVVEDRAAGRSAIGGNHRRDRGVRVADAGQCKGEALVRLGQRIARDRDGDRGRGLARGNRPAERSGQRAAGEVRRVCRALGEAGGKCQVAIDPARTRDGEGVERASGVALGQADRTGEAHRLRLALRAVGGGGDGEIVDRQRVVRARDVEIGEADEDRRPRRDAQPTDRARQRGAVGGEVAVESAERRRGARADEIERVEIGPPARRVERGGGGAVLEVEPVARAAVRHPRAPLLAGVADRQRGDRRAGVVGEADPEQRGQASAQQPAERPVGRARRAEAVGVAARRGAGPGGVGEVGVGPALEELPAVGQQQRIAQRAHPGAGAGRNQAVEVFRVSLVGIERNGHGCGPLDLFARTNRSGCGANRAGEYG